MRPVRTVTLPLDPNDDHTVSSQVEKWAKENGYVCSPCCVAGGGEYKFAMMPASEYSDVAKWRNLTLKERDQLAAVATFSRESVTAVIEVYREAK